MILAMAGYVLNDSMMKLSSTEMGIFQAIFIRGLFVSISMAALCLRQGSSLNPFRYMNPAILSRVSAEIVGTACFLIAITKIAITNATAILQAIPFVLTLAAAIFLKEKVGWQRYIAIIIGFIGVIIIVRPGVDGFSLYSLLVLVTVFTVVIRDLATQQVASDIPTAYLAYMTAIFTTTMGGVVSLVGDVSNLSPWISLSISNVVLLLGASGFLIVGYLCGIMTMRVGEVSFIAPFRYTVLIWAIIIGIVVFGDIPDALTLFGCTVVVIAGVYSFYRERAALRKDQ